MTQTVWMVRAEGGKLFDRFEQGVVALSGAEMGDLSLLPTLDAVRSHYYATYPDEIPPKGGNAVAALDKFRHVIGVGSKVVTYSPLKRLYLVGEVTSDYRFDPKAISAEYPHVRDVRWHGQVARDVLSASTRNTLGSTLPVFQLGDDASAEVLSVSAGERKDSTPSQRGDPRAEVEVVNEDEAARSLELVKDAIVSLGDRAVEELTASVLRAMGYRARVTPIGPDRGVDVVASPDGLGLKEPRIKAEVKHRPKSQMGAPEIRGFLGALRTGDRGLYVSTGGFTKEAKYEAERANIPVTLVDLSDLASLVISHYESFDVEGRVILPLVRVYLPAE